MGETTWQMVYHGLRQQREAVIYKMADAIDLDHMIAATLWRKELKKIDMQIDDLLEGRTTA